MVDIDDDDDVMQVTLADYWQFVAKSVEWIYVLKKLGDSVKQPPEMRHAATATHSSGAPLYLLKKEFYAPEVIAKALGLPADKLAGYEGPIVLKGAAEDTLPEVTVNYWGEA